LGTHIIDDHLDTRVDWFGFYCLAANKIGESREFAAAFTQSCENSGKILLLHFAAEFENSISRVD
jgi:hypothetical protein